MLGDPVRLQQIICNLLTNAVKFTPPGGRVDVVVDRQGRDACIRVSDTGIGIDRTFLPHVFDRFRQADRATRRTTGGLGLGLAIVRQLTELHGGSVSAESDGPGRGATFLVRLPLVSSPGTIPPSRRRPRIEASTADEGCSSARASCCSQAVAGTSGEAGHTEP